MDPIAEIRQMMAEQKLFEAQKLIEVQLNLNLDSRHELLLLYFENLSLQKKQFPFELAIELGEQESVLKNHDVVLRLIENIIPDEFFVRKSKLRMAAYEDRGSVDELYKEVSEFLLRQFDHQTPSVPDWVSNRIQKYFKHDFNLKLKRLGLSLLLNDIELAESLVKELLLSCVERSSPKGTSSKFEAIGDVLRSGRNKGHLEIYQNLCFIAAQGLTDKAHYKRLVEMVIYFDDFKFQALLLHLLDTLDLKEEAKLFAEALRQTEEYSFIYFDKYFPHLKPYFIKTQSPQDLKKEEMPVLDLSLTERQRSEVLPSEDRLEGDEIDEQKFYHLLKYQSFTAQQLCDLAVSFIQLDMPKVALKATEFAIGLAEDKRQNLKASYLKLTCQLKLCDYRAAVDTCFEGLTKAESQDDILSFMYGQAEAYIRLNQKSQAESVLKKILSIDEKYRLAKERLDKLNEI